MPKVIPMLFEEVKKMWYADYSAYDKITKKTK